MISTRRAAAVISFSDIGNDPRVSKQLDALHDDLDLIAAGTGPPRQPGVQFVKLPQPVRRRSQRRRALDGLRLITRRYESHYWQDDAIMEAQRRLEQVSADIWIANDLPALPLALRVARGAPVVFDAHEYELDQMAGIKDRVLYTPARRYLCGRYLPQAAAMFTVCEGIADLYQRDFGVEPQVLLNAPHYDNALSPSSVGKPIELVHHGISEPDRHIEHMFKLADLLGERFRLTLMLVPRDPAYMKRIEQLARAHPHVSLVPPVPMPEIGRTINRFDMGLYILPPTTLNARLSLPNKFFEFIQARLAIAIGPSPEMARIVRRHDLGLVAGDFSPITMARQLSQITTRDVEAWKQRSHAVAQQYSAETTWNHLREATMGLLPTAQQADGNSR